MIAKPLERPVHVFGPPEALLTVADTGSLVGTVSWKPSSTAPFRVS